MYNEYLHCFQRIPTLKFSEKSYKFKFSRETGAFEHHLIFITVHVICPTAELFVECVHLELTRHIISRMVQRRKYHTTVKNVSIKIKIAVTKI